MYYDSEGPLSYQTTTPWELPKDRIPIGEVMGDSCQHGLSIPIIYSAIGSGEPVSGAAGDGSYRKALRDIARKHPDIYGLVRCESGYPAAVNSDDIQPKLYYRGRSGISSENSQEQRVLLYSLRMNGRNFTLACYLRPRVKLNASFEEWPRPHAPDSWLRSSSVAPFV